MSSPFDIAAPGAQSGLDNLFSGTGSANDAPKGLFSSLVSLMGGTNGPKISDLVQVGSPKNSGEAWLNLQLGDASVSLSAQALTAAASPEELLSMVPGILDELNVDDLAAQGLANLGQTISNALNAQNTTPNAAQAATNPLLALQEAAQNIVPQVQAATEIPSQVAGNAASAIANALSDTADLGQKSMQVAANASAFANSKEISGLPLTPEQMASRDSLAAQLQQQMSGTKERFSVAAQNGSQNAASANNAANAQTPPGFAAALSQLPFVQTRQITTTHDPLMVAQNLAPTAGKSEQAALFQPVKAAYQSPQVNLPHMAVAIARNFAAGKNNFQIRLDPAELGRVNIQLNVDDAGTVNARMLVERPETLQLLQQDARALERALSQAGLDGAKANLEFFQKDNPFSGGHNNNADQQDANAEPDQSQNGEHTGIAAYQGSVSEGGVSLWI